MESSNTTLRGSAELARAKMEFPATPSPNESKEGLETDIQDSPPSETEEIEYPKGAKLFFIVIALALSIFLVSLDMTIVATAIPKITDDFHGLGDVSWYGSAFFLTLAAFQSTWGKIYKFFPLKVMFLISIGIFELGSLLCGVAPNSVTLIIGRAIAGIGGAGIGSGAYTIVAFAASPAKRPAMIGIIGGSYGVASVIGPLLGGVFTEKVTWRLCFYINLPIGLVSAIIIFFMFHTPKAAKPVDIPLKEKLLNIDMLGTFTIMAAVCCYILALQKGGITSPWKSAEVIGLLVGFALISVLFIGIQYFLGERAIIVGRLMKNRTVSVGMFFIFLNAGAFFLLLYYIPIYFQVVGNTSASQSGVRSLPLIIALTLCSVVSGVMVTLYGHYVPWLIIGGSLVTLGSGLLYTLDLHTSSGKWIGYQIIAGMGAGLANQIPVTSIQGSIAAEDISVASAMVLFAQTIGGAFFVSAGQTAFANTLLRSIPKYAPSIDPAQVIATGATELRKVFPAEAILGIIQAYMQGLKVAYAIAIAAGGLATIVSLFSKWKSLKGVVVTGAV